ncbi:MAG: TfoX/Sxy family protein [Lysobacterales bacterium]
MSPSAKIRNIGPKSAAWLRQVGIRSEADIKQAGALAVFMKVRKAGFRPSLNLLYALEGAVQGCHWTALGEQRKSELVLEVNAIEDGKAPKSWNWWRPGDGAAAVHTETVDAAEETSVRAEPDDDQDDPADADEELPDRD